jgi:hypothetical protein
MIQQQYIQTHLNELLEILLEEAHEIQNEDFKKDCQEYGIQLGLCFLLEQNGYIQLPKLVHYMDKKEQHYVACSALKNIIQIHIFKS